MPIISCIVPVYNVEKYLANCVDSILKQTFANFELILVDDGSTDKSSSICDEYAIKDSRIKVIHKINGGVSSARNTGLDIAKGEYITFIDSDDWVDSNYFLTLYKAAIETNADLVICGFKEEMPKNCFSENSDMFFKECCFSNQLVYNKKEFFENFPKIRADKTLSKILQLAVVKLIKFTKNINFVRFDETMRNGEDYLFYLQIYKRMNSICFIKPCLYYYRYTLGSAGKQISEKRIMDDLFVVSETESVFKEFCPKQSMPFFYKYKKDKLVLLSLSIFIQNSIRKCEHLDKKLSIIRREISLKIILTDFLKDITQLKQTVLLLAIKLHLQFIYILRYKNKKRKQLPKTYEGL